MVQLKQQEIAEIQRALEKFELSVRDGMRAALAEARHGNDDMAGEVHDLGDESLADELLAVNSALAERHGRELQQAERARQRIADGVVGTCIDCDGDIGVKRLVANPVAERCIGCESKHERSYAHAATPRL
jgi:DnaK suppressor protein